MEIIKLQAPQVPYIWGGDKLNKKFGKEAGQSIGESWELSYDDKFPCLVGSGEHKGKRLKDVLTAKEIGSNSDGMEFFPLLIKLIDARDNLSVQVHPSDEYALANENQYGKTEMWYVLDAEDGGKICYGLKEDVDREELMDLMQSGEIMDKLNFVPVKKGDIFFVESGTIHAIGKGTTIYEVQQNSTLTYRLFDYLRQDKDGNYRELHLEKSKAVANLKAVTKKDNNNEKIDVETFPSGVIEKKILSYCKYFVAIEYNFYGEVTIKQSKNTFQCLTCVDGEGEINGMKFNRGDSFFIPAGEGETKIIGVGSFVMAKVSKLIKDNCDIVNDKLITDDGDEL